MSKALVVLSGGQDSTTCLYYAKQHFDEVHAITFDYGQRHSRELDAAMHIGKMAGVASHEVLGLGDNILHSASPLTSKNELDTYQSFEQMDKESGKKANKIEQTFVPMRNSLFFILAANRAVALGCTAIVTGICQEDNAGYPDCTELFRLKLESTINQSLSGSGRTISIMAPLMYLSKGETVKLSRELPGCWEALAYSHTCYAGEFPPCDKCHSCLLRAHGFEEAGVEDPLVERGALLC